jgi:ABC-type amino acid transport substrate-binding protein
VRPGRRAARLLLGTAALLALSTGCGHASTPAASTSAAGTTGAGTTGAGTTAASPPAAGTTVTGTPAAAGGDSDAFCALAREKGAADLLNLRDGSAPGGGLDKVLANLDVLTAAAPAEIKGDYTRLDQLEHALLGRRRDPQQLARVDSPDTVASLQRIQRYLAGHCGIGQ